MLRYVVRCLDCILLLKHAMQAVLRKALADNDKKTSRAALLHMLQLTASTDPRCAVKEGEAAQMVFLLCLNFEGADLFCTPQQHTSYQSELEAQRLMPYPVLCLFPLDVQC